MKGIMMCVGISVNIDCLSQNFRRIWTNVLFFNLTFLITIATQKIKVEQVEGTPIIMKSIALLCKRQLNKPASMGKSVKVGATNTSIVESWKGLNLKRFLPEECKQLDSSF